MLSLALAGLAPAAQADPNLAHDWTCHSDAAGTGCPTTFAVQAGDTLWLHDHSGAPTLARWAHLFESGTPLPYSFCVVRSISGGGSGSVTLLAGRTYSIVWGRAQPTCPLGPERFVPDPTLPVHTFFVPIGNVDDPCVVDPTPQYREDCLGRNRTDPDCYGLQRYGPGRVGYTHLCTGPGDAYGCTGDEWYTASAEQGFAAQSSSSGVYSELCAGVLDWCAGVWSEEGAIEGGRRVPGGRTWAGGSPICLVFTA